MAGKPARQPPAGPPSPAPSCIKPPGHQRAPPSPSGKSAYQFPRLAPPSPSGKREPAARRAPLRMPDRYIRSVAGPPGARRPPPPGKARTSSPGSRRPPPPGNANQPPGARRCACTTATSVLWWGPRDRAPSPSGKREPRPRRAPPSPPGKREPRPRRAPLRMPDRYIRSVAGPPGARRFAAEGGGRGAENILFLIPEYPLTTA